MNVALWKVYDNPDLGFQQDLEECQEGDNSMSRSQEKGVGGNDGHDGDENRRGYPAALGIRLGRRRPRLHIHPGINGKGQKTVKTCVLFDEIKIGVTALGLKSTSERIHIRRPIEVGCEIEKARGDHHEDG